MLTTAIFVPLLGAFVIAFLSNDRERLIRRIAIGAASVPLLILGAAWIRFEGTGGFELVESASWIPTLGVVPYQHKRWETTFLLWTSRSEIP